MSWGFKNIEDFLRRKLSQLDHKSVDDWDIFEAKLRKAILYRDLRQFSIAGLTAIMLSFWVFNNYQLPGEPFNFASKKERALEMVRQNEAGVNDIPIKNENLRPVAYESELPSIKSDINNKVNLAEDKLVDKKVAKSQLAVAPETEASFKGGEQKKVKTGDFKDLAAVVASNNNENLVESNALKNSDYGLVEYPEANYAIRDKEDLVTLSALSTPISAGYGALKLREQSGNVLSLQRGLSPISISELMLIKPNFYSGSDYNIAYISPLQARNPWSYSINVYPNFSFRKFKVDQNKAKLLHRDFIDAMQVSERSGFALNIGLEISKRIGRITYLNSGIEYISTKTETNFDFNNFRDAIIDGTTGEILSYKLRHTPQRITLNQYNQYHYLNLPLSISYQPWISDHVRANIEGGTSVMYFVDAQGKTLDYRTLEIVELGDQHYKKYIGSFFAKIGLQYYVSPKINIGFEPTLMYFTNTIYSEDYPFHVIPYSMGLNLNLQVKLN